LKLRDYQVRAKAEIWQYWKSGKGNSPLAVLATGAGKSVLCASIIRDIQAKNPDARIIIATHVRELIRQNLEALLEIDPGIDAGIMSAGLKSRDTANAVIFAGVQTAFRRKDLGRFALLIIDEAHLMSRRANSMYGKLVETLRNDSPELRLLGLTATPYRLDSGLLHEGKDAIFDGIACEVKTRELVKKKYLAPMQSWAPASMKSLKLQAGEFTPDSQRLSISENLTLWAEKIRARTSDLKTLIFVPSVAVAEELAETLKLLGLRASSITGDTPAEVRDARMEDFRAGTITHMTNVNVMTTGMNIPDIEAIVLMRATMSPGLLEQMLGRGLRTAPGKERCILMDFGGNIERHGPYDAIRPPQPEGEKGNTLKPLTRTCPECGFIMKPTERECPQCGYRFPEREHYAFVECETDEWKRMFGWNAEPYTAKASGREMIRIECILSEDDSDECSRQNRKVAYAYVDPRAGPSTYPFKKFNAIWRRTCPVQDIPEDLPQVARMINEGRQTPGFVRTETKGRHTGVNAFQWEYMTLESIGPEPDRFDGNHFHPGLFPFREYITIKAKCHNFFAPDYLLTDEWEISIEDQDGRPLNHHGRIIIDPAHVSNSPKYGTCRFSFVRKMFGECSEFYYSIRPASLRGMPYLVGEYRL